MKGGHFFPEENPDDTVVLVKRFLSAVICKREVVLLATSSASEVANRGIIRQRTKSSRRALRRRDGLSAVASLASTGLST